MTTEPTRPPILSATVILGRDGHDGLEVFMVKRNRQIDFASGALVFPGGKVDDDDRSPSLQPHCLGASNWSDRERCLRVAAIREVYEEAGIFLAQYQGSGKMISAADLERLSSERGKLCDGAISLETLITAENLLLACDALVPFAHWITPEQMPKRFDTVFFLAETPGDHLGQHDGHESVDSVWITPEEAVRQAESGTFTMIFPTKMNMLKLARYATLEKALQGARSESLVTITPWVEERNGELTLCIPEHAGYPVTSESLAKVMGQAKGK